MHQYEKQQNQFQTGLQQGEMVLANPQDSLKNGTLVATSELKNLTKHDLWSSL